MIQPKCTIYLLNVCLDDGERGIHREVLVPETLTLLDLHSVLQIVFGWNESHMHLFNIKGITFSDQLADGRDGDEVEREDVTLGEMISSVGRKFIYEYDFGDSWTHRITVKKISPDLGDQFLPVCLSGEKAAPPEDCGGVPGFMNLVEIFEKRAAKKKLFDDDLNMLEWVGEDYDPHHFDLKQVNKELKKAFQKKPKKSK